MQDVKDKPSIWLHTKFDTSVFTGRFVCFNIETGDVLTAPNESRNP